MVLLVLVASGASAKAWTFLLAGQSNMVGNYAWDRTDPEEPVPASYLWCTMRRDSPRWAPLRHGCSGDTTHFGPEMAIANTLSGLFPADTLRFIKVASGGTSLAEDWLPPSIGAEGRLFTRIRAALRESKSSWPGSEARIDGVFWMQGESDATRQAWAESYEGRLDRFIRDLRTELGDPGVLFILGLIDVQPSWTYANLVRAAQIRVALEDTGTTFVETAGLPSDRTHFTSAGQWELGRRLALAWNALRSGVEMESRQNQVSLWSILPDGRKRLVMDIPLLSRVSLVGVDGKATAWSIYTGQQIDLGSTAPGSRSWFLQVREPGGRETMLRTPPVVR